MRLIRQLALIIIAAALIAGSVPARSDAGVYVGIGISVGFAPPALPVYYQPPPPAPNLIWQPGYWYYGPYGYYWVPATWVAPPAVGLLWTPGYWGWSGGYYRWNGGYWAPHVGFYGGINYGFGYFGLGYVGGGWYGNVFRYNTAVTTVNQTIVRNVYYNRTVINNLNTTNRVSYNGGNGGIRAYPTASEQAVANETRYGPTSEQQAHITYAQQNRNYLASVNHGAPAAAAAPQPFSAGNRPTNYTPVRTQDRVTTTGAPAYQPQTVQHTQPAYQPPAVQHNTQPAYQAQTVPHEQPAYHPQAYPTYHSTYHPQPAYHPVTPHQTTPTHPPAPHEESAPRPRPSHVPHG